MESGKSVDRSDLLAKLTRLENQVVTLSSQLETNHMVICQLKQSIAERDTRIGELESKLMTAQQSFRKTAIERIVQCREQIKNGMDVNVVQPVLTQIQKCIQAIEGLLAESGDFISRKREQLAGGFISTTNRIRLSPDQAKNYLDNRLIEPVTAMLRSSVQSARFYHQKSSEWFERDLVNRCKALVEHIAFIAGEVSLNIRIILETRVIHPFRAFMDNLPALIQDSGKKMLDWQKHALGILNQMIRDSLEFMMNLVKNSPFWDGKHRMQGAA